jgi:hypothetical protein
MLSTGSPLSRGRTENRLATQRFSRCALKFWRTEILASESARVLCGPRQAVFPFRLPRNAEGVERQAAHQFSVLPRSVSGTRAPLGAPLAALVTGSSPATQLQSRASWDEEFAPVPVQRAPRSAVVMPRGRGPGAARVRGYEPRPQAPHQPAAVSRRRSFAARRPFSGVAPHRGPILETSREDALSQARRGEA